jgi:hypothetical protein
MEQQALVESQARVEEVEEEQAFIDLDVITKHGITKTDVNKFKDAGFLTVSLPEVTSYICKLFEPVQSSFESQCTMSAPDGSLRSRWSPSCMLQRKFCST